MFGLDWIAIAEVISIAFAAGFGMFALLNDYKVEGEVTKAGRIALGGIIFSAVLSVIIKIGQLVEAEASADQTRLAAEAKHDELLGAMDRAVGDIEGVSKDLIGLRSSTKTLNEDMDESIALQGQSRDELIGAAERLRVLSDQQDQATHKVISTIWNESNRIDLSSLNMNITFFCTTDSRIPGGLLDEGLIASIDIVSSVDADPVSIFRRFHRLSARPEIYDFDYLYSGLVFPSRVTSKRPFRDEALWEESYSLTFSALRSKNLEHWNDPNSWKEARVRVQLSAETDSEWMSFLAAKDELPLTILRSQLEDKMHHMSWRGIKNASGCIARISFDANGRTLFRDRTYFYFRDASDLSPVPTVRLYYVSPPISGDILPSFEL